MSLAVREKGGPEAFQSKRLRRGGTTSLAQVLSQVAPEWRPPVAPARRDEHIYEALGILRRDLRAGVEHADKQARVEALRRAPDRPWAAQLQFLTRLRLTIEQAIQGAIPQ